VKLFVGNLSFNVKDDDLRSSFEAFGRVDSAAVIREKFSSESRGFGFVEMPSRDEAQAAIEGMNGKEFMGRNLNVNEARPMPERTGGGGGGGSRGGFNSHRPDSRRRDGSKRKSGSNKGRSSRFNKRSY
jgi:RNA recognition motif-containing protein